MRIVHLTSVHRRYDPRIFLKQCRSAASNGWDTVLVVADGLGNETRDGVKIFDVGKPSSRRARVLFASRKVMMFAKGLNANVIQLHDPELLLHTRLLSSCGAAVGFDSHEDVAVQFLGKPYLTPMLRRFIANLIGRFLSRKFSSLDFLISATPFIAAKLSLVNECTETIRNLPLVEEFRGVSSERTRGKEVVYVGGVSADRGVLEMIQAVHLCPGVKLNIVGDFVPPVLIDEARRLDGWSSVNSFGFQGRDFVADCFARSSAGLVILHPKPNYVDALPVKMFEYMSAGLPVICSDFPVWRATIEQYRCAVFVDPLNVRDVSNAINEIVNSDTMVRELGANGRKAIEKELNWELEVKKLFSLYTRIGGENAKRQRIRKRA